MIEFAHGFFNLEHPAANHPLPAGRNVLRGWLVEKPGQVLTDLRIRHGSLLWPAVYGFIRADLAAHFKHPTPYLPAAFETLVFLQPGPAVLEFEALSISGKWVPVCTIETKVNAPSSEDFVPDEEALVRTTEFADLLRHLLRLCAASPDTSLKDLTFQLVSSLPCPRYLLHPSPPFHAFFLEPAIITRAAYGRLQVDGYLFHQHAPISRILATLDLHVWQAVAHGGISPIAPQLFPHQPNAFRSNIKGYIEAPAQLPQPLTLRIYAELPDGSLHLCAVQQTFTFGLEEEKKAFPSASPILFLRAARMLYLQLKKKGVSISSGPMLRKKLWETWKEFYASAPRRKSLVGAKAIYTPSPVNKPLGHILVFTQNLDYEGAPLLLLEYCRHLITHGGAKLTLISAHDGPLRAEFEAAGAAIQIVDATPLARAKSPTLWRSALRTLSSEIDCSSATLIVANTLASYWAIHLAHEAGKPSLFYIHESTTPAAFYHGTAMRTIVPFVEASFGLSTRVSFNTASTARYYAPFATQPNYHLNPGWINLAAIDAHRDAHPRNELRVALGVSAERKLVVNLGAICERKGQHIFAWAVDLLWRRQPELAAQCDFWMVGGRQTPFDTSMAALVVSLGRANLRIVGETIRAYDFLGAADLFVCSSYEESFPRVVLEAMGMEVPILSTHVHGIPEMVVHEKEALLVPPGDSSALADGLARLLSDASLARDYASRARVRVASNFDAAIVLPRQLELAHHTIAIESGGS